MTTIVAVDVAVCAVPTAHPIRLGASTICEREYGVLRLRTDDGRAGTGLGYTRGTRLGDALVRLAPLLLGRDALARDAVLGRLRDAAVRARSLVDVALHDILAQVAELPLWRLLGGARPRVPLLAVAGYAAGDPADELRALAAAGFRRLKVHAAEFHEAERLRAAVPDVPLAVDLGMTFRTVSDALLALRPFDELGLDFLEDPFPPEQWHETAELAAQLATPIAAGEDAHGFDALRRLAGAVTILRLDASSSGGFSAVTRAAPLARTAMTHAFPDLHGSLAGLSEVGLVETIPYGSGGNPVHVLMTRRQAIDGGELVLAEEPGHGMPLDWDAVLRHARSITTIDREG
jgi:L-alanine-DL-glutamate epimerase-like enolase superfamily enzyme